jgi:hypothetical protein
MGEKRIANGAGSQHVCAVNATVPDFLMNAEQVCLVKEGKVQARITPAGASATGGPTVQEQIRKARQLKAQLAARYGEDDWTPQDYLAAGRRS